MSYLKEYFQFLTDVVLVNGFGWLGFLILLIYMLGWLRRDRLRNEYVGSVKWIFLEVKIDELNEKSPLAMEQVFAALHAIHQNFTWGEDLDGKIVLFISCEIVSLGGKVSFFFKMPERYRSLFESALFAQYPKVEVREVEDYLKNIPHFYDPDHANFDFWGTQWLKKKPSAYPIRTYMQDESFEHSSQETFIDPLSNLIEVMSNAQPHELMAYQLVIKPVNDDWKEHTKHLLDELKGVPNKHKPAAWEKIFLFIPDLLADILVTDFLGVEKGDGKQVARVQEEPPSLMLHKTDIEKLVINGVARSMGKVSYNVRIRTMYLTPKDQMNKSRISEIVGALRNFDDMNLNGIKPDIGHTWTDKAYKISPILERPYLEMNILTRKRHFLHNFSARSSWRGSGMVLMNTEELASIYHFPQVPHTRVTQLEKISTGKVAPPIDLPIIN